MAQLRTPASPRVAGSVLLAALLLGAGAAKYPFAAVGAVALAGLAVLSVSVASNMHRYWLAAAACLLVGYAFLGKGFAYLGAPPLYVGEAVLGLGLLAVAVSGGIGLALRSPLSWLWLLLALHGVLRTLPYVGRYGFDALRDAVIWGYGAYALLAAAFLLRTGWLTRALEGYGRWLPRFLVWMPFAIIAGRLLGDLIPRAPGSDVAILFLKPGDVGVHLAGAACFLILGLHEFLPARRSRGSVWLREWVWWTAWVASGLLVASSNRGGLLSIILATGLVMLLRPPSVGRWGKALLVAGFGAALLLALNIELDLGGSRTVSPRQVAANVQSIVGGEEDGGGLSNTRQWRLEWWGDIVDYTVFGPYFLSGKGYGINLAEDDGFVGTTFEGLRSPHNGHLTILARGGVPGLALWLLLQGAWAASMLLAYLRARRAGQDRWARVNLWVLAYWLAFIVNASFDVFLEGPHQGIWFWCLFGFGIALLEVQKEREHGWRARARAGAAP